MKLISLFLETNKREKKQDRFLRCKQLQRSTWVAIKAAKLVLCKYARTAIGSENNYIQLVVFYLYKKNYQARYFKKTLFGTFESGIGILTHTVINNIKGSTFLIESVVIFSISHNFVAMLSKPYRGKCFTTQTNICAKCNFMSLVQDEQ